MSEMGVRKVSLKEIVVPCYEYEKTHLHFNLNLEYFAVVFHYT